MSQLRPIFLIMPAVLFVFGILMSVANIAELRVTASVAGMQASIHTELRITYLAGLVRSFYDMFFFWGLAALVAAANRYVEVR
ncbi:hypothetical protein QTA57_03810 [Fontisubflavum oceani]|uniref:hypothetical protein n=1 Tax=Fontisubflavum oceani TaxID=2978973 RepID=UPI0025B4FA28|nr:hypothetical protein [Fontisubflavum oceani]WJY22286.1 hypothetical protein QTA57_03810 [Fontisubflavum oceani]